MNEQTSGWRRDRSLASEIASSGSESGTTMRLSESGSESGSGCEGKGDADDDDDDDDEVLRLRVRRRRLAFGAESAL